jgi:hypothetical protein
MSFAMDFSATPHERKPPHATMSVDAETSTLGRAPVVLQVLPALNTGGVERGTVDVAEAVVQAGGKALVASEGGRLVHELQRVGAAHLELPLASKNPLVSCAHGCPATSSARARWTSHAAAAPAWSAARLLRHRRASSRPSRHPTTAPRRSPLQFGDDARRP